MKIPFFGHATNGSLKSQKASAHSSDIELGLSPFSSSSKTLDLSSLVRNENLVTKLYERAAYHDFDAGSTATPEAPKKAPKNRIEKKHLLLVVAPTLAGIASGVTYGLTIAAKPKAMLTEFHQARACRASVCQGFAKPVYAILGGGSEYWDYTKGDEHKACLNHFLGGFYDDSAGQFITFSRTLVPDSGASSGWKAIQPCDPEKLNSPYEPFTKTTKATFSVALVVDVLALAAWLRKPKKGAKKHWLSQSLQRQLSPRLYSLIEKLPSMSRQEQEDMRDELMPILQTLLAQSVERCDKSTTRELLALGISPTEPVIGGRNAFEVSLSMPRALSDFENILKAGGPVSSSQLYAAAKAADIDTALLLLDKLASGIDHTTTHMQPIVSHLPDAFLFEFCRAPAMDSEKMRSLLQRLDTLAGRFIDARDELDRTPLHIAAFWQHHALKNVLEAYHADTAAVDAFGKTPDDLLSLSIQASVAY